MYRLIFEKSVFDTGFFLLKGMLKKSNESKR